jgi:hypothetical protein
MGKVQNPVIPKNKILYFCFCKILLALMKITSPGFWRHIDFSHCLDPRNFSHLQYNIQQWKKRYNILCSNFYYLDYPDVALRYFHLQSTHKKTYPVVWWWSCAPCYHLPCKMHATVDTWPAFELFSHEARAKVRVMGVRDQNILAGSKLESVVRDR